MVLSQIIFIAVPTPPQADGSVDLTYIEQVAREVSEVLTEYRVIVDKSTVPVKTGEKVADTIRRYNTIGADFDVVSNPEFLREGSAVADLTHPDRIKDSCEGLVPGQPRVVARSGRYDKGLDTKLPDKRTGPGAEPIRLDITLIPRQAKRSYRPLDHEEIEVGVWRQTKDCYIHDFDWTYRFDPDPRARIRQHIG